MADEVRLTNSAERIANLIGVAQRTGAGTINDGFARVFEIDKDDRAEMYRRLSTASQETIFIGTLLSIADHAELEIFFNPSKTKIIQFFSPQKFDGPWVNHLTVVEPQDTKTLAIISALLKKKRAEVLVDSAELQDVLAKVVELRDEILKADIYFDLKAILLENLKRLEHSVRDYNVRGAAGLHESTLLVAQNVKNLLKTEKRNARKKKVSGWDYLIRVAAITTIIANLVTAASPFMRTLPPIQTGDVKVFIAPQIDEAPMKKVPALPPAEKSEPPPKDSELKRV